MKDHLQPDLPNAMENHILQHVFRNQLTTRDVLRRLFFQDLSVNAVTRKTSSLVERGYLSRHRLLAKRVYFRAGRRSVSRFRLSRNAARPLPKQRLPVELASLAYCCSGPVVRKRLKVEELASEYPWFPRQLAHTHPYYFDYEEGLRRLASIRVELSGSPTYIVQKQTRELYELAKNNRFRKLLERDEFLIVTITTSPERRDALIHEIATQKWYPASRVLDFPELIEFL